MSNSIPSSDAQSVREDIAFMRNLAQEGAAGPIFGGSMLVAMGLIYSVTCLVLWFLLTRVPSAAGPWLSLLWVGAMGVHAVAATIFVWRLKRRGLVLARANRSNRMFAKTWNAVGMAIMSCLASFALTSLLRHTPQVFAGYPAVIFALYGVGWSVTAASSNERWTWGVAILSFLFAIGCGALAGNVNLLLLYAAALVLLLTVPGAVLIRRAASRS